MKYILISEVYVLSVIMLFFPLNKIFAQPSSKPLQVEGLEIKAKLTGKNNLEVKEEIVLSDSSNTFTRNLSKKYFLEKEVYPHLIKDINVYLPNGTKLGYEMKESDDKITLLIDAKKINSKNRRLLINYRAELPFVESGENLFEYFFVPIGNYSDDTEIKTVVAEITTEEVPLQSVSCLTGKSSNLLHNCLSEFSGQKAIYKSAQVLGAGEGFFLSFETRNSEIKKVPSGFDNFLLKTKDFVRLHWVEIGFFILAICFLLLLFFKVFRLRLLK